MGWQARIPKEKKEKFEKTCNKCNGTGVKRKYIALGGYYLPAQELTKCKCQSAKVNISPK